MTAWLWMRDLVLATLVFMRLPSGGCVILLVIPAPFCLHRIPKSYYVNFVGEDWFSVAV